MQGDNIRIKSSRNFNKCDIVAPVMKDFFKFGSSPKDLIKIKDSRIRVQCLNYKELNGNDNILIFL